MNLSLNYSKNVWYYVYKIYNLHQRNFIKDSGQFSHSVMSDSLWPRGLQHTRTPCPLPTPRVHSNSCPLSWWCHPTISSCCPLLLPPPASGSFPMSRLLASGGQRIGTWASAPVLPMNIQDWLPLGLVGSPCSPGDSPESSPTPQFRSINSSVFSFLYSPMLTSIHDYWKKHSFYQMDIWWQSNVSAF